ncbi:MAG: adenylyl-sulfate kinase [Porticoccaceae bacterium]|nr:adenylyl-sulfate kinase [Porticoccaceae bacterium]MDG1473747.1 adenylyl-sulfate kinase [Porticoccaceae bacterium]
MVQDKSTNVTWHDGLVSCDERASLLEQKGVTLWFTGLSGSGKSTIAVALERRLMDQGKLSYRLDGDNIRLGINKNLGFSADDRTENIRRIGEISKLFCDVGILTLASFISPYRDDRDHVRQLHEASDFSFVEIFVDCALSSAEERDPKGLYKKARAGEIKNFTGIDDPYEVPNNPEIHLRSDVLSLDQEVDAIMAFLQHNKFVV